MKILPAILITLFLAGCFPYESVKHDANFLHATEADVVKAKPIIAAAVQRVEAITEKVSEIKTDISTDWSKYGNFVIAGVIVLIWFDLRRKL